MALSSVSEGKKRKRESSVKDSNRVLISNCLKDEEIDVISCDMDDVASGSATMHSSASDNDNITSSQFDLYEEISKWTEVNLTKLAIEVCYEEHTTPLNLLKSFVPSFHPIYNPIFRLSERQKMLPHVDYIEEYFNNFCDFHVRLNKDIRYLTGTDIDNLLRSERYIESEFLSILSSRDGCTEAQLNFLRHWFEGYDQCKINFGHRLDNIIKKEKCKNGPKDYFVVETLTEYDFQFLFEAFASMFGLKNYGWSKPLMPQKTMELSGVQAVGKADILYCQEFKYNCPGKLSENLHIVAVCEVEKITSETHKQHCTEPQKLKRPSCKGKLAPHLESCLLGQHGGKLLLYYDQAAQADIIFGLIVQKTQVTFTALKMTTKQYENIKSGRCDEPKAKMILTKPYDFMKKDDRSHLIRPLLELAVLQEVK